GQRIEPLGPGLARRVPAGSKFVFQMHYTPNGSEQQDLTRIGLIFADPAEVKEEVVTVLAMNQTFEIPPNAKDYPVEATLKRFPRDGRLLAIVPHMHVRGSAFRVEADIPGQATETLIDVPRYDFNWQTTYLLEEPRTFPAETKIRCIAKFDNSAGNPNNPDPSSAVRWGDQTWEEMALGYFAVAVPLRSTEDEPMPVVEEKLTAEQETEIATKSQKLLKQLDTDGNGVVNKSEVPEQFAIFGFKRFDADENGELTMEEIRKAVEQSVRRKARRRN
ncbi:MAG TPA: EF-hand domain-containing protein, partial [Planctomycetaceae bacterium]|nr:EF-hand domain-containing protein [Planctomycetaceae bacterium]